MAVANQKGGVAKTTTVHSLGVRLGRAGPPHPGRRPRPPGLPDLLAGLRPRRPRPLASRRLRPHVTGVPTSSCPCPGSTGSTSCRPPSTWPAPRSTCSPGPVGSTCWHGRSSPVLRRLRPDPHRLPAVAGRPDHQRADRRQRGAHPAAVRGPVTTAASGQLLETIEDVRAFANSDLDRAGRHRHHVRRPHPPRPRTSSKRSQSRYGMPGAAAPGAQVDPVRRGPGPGEVHPPARPELAGCRGLPALARAARRRSWSRHRARALSDPGSDDEEPSSPTDPTRWGSGRSSGLPVEREADDGRRVPTEREVAGKHALFSVQRRIPTAATPRPAGPARPARRAATPAASEGAEVSADDPLPPAGVFAGRLLLVRVGRPRARVPRLPRGSSSRSGPGFPGGVDRPVRSTCPACGAVAPGRA